MKKTLDTPIEDELRQEYDASQLRNGARGKYAERYKSGTNLALLEPDVAAAFPDDESVNEALRMLMRVADSSAKGTVRRRRTVKTR
jgi:hypothetical protein